MESKLIHNHYLNGANEDGKIYDYLTDSEPDTDFIGFSFNGFHSSELGIKRASNGSRFEESLLPTIQDKTVQVPGGDGMYYFGSYYTQRQFNIIYAFDELTEEQLAKIKTVFGDKKIHDLIFDEAPYKVYRAKVTGSSSIKYIPFGEGATNRIYKGEGSIQFTAYEPYARSVHKYADEYDVKNYEQWEDAANLLSSQGAFDSIDGNIIRLYNPGDKDSDFILTLNFNESGVIPGGSIEISSKNDIRQLHFSQISRLGEDDQIKINTKINLLEGYNSARRIKTGNVYNKYITKGTFFKIPMSTDIIEPLQLVIAPEELAAQAESIEYNYYYF